MLSFLQNNLPFFGYPYKGSQIPCNLCQSDRTVVICSTDRRWKNLVTVACADCGLMRTDPIPTDSELAQYYASSYRFDYQMAGSKPPKFHLVRSARDARMRAAALEPYLVDGAKVLDFGCGTGEFLKLAKDKGCTVTGIEPGEDYAKFARETHGLNVINSPWQQVTLPAGGMDVISCNQVLEHLRDPMAAIAAINRWLKMGGVFYASVPDMRPSKKPSFERFHFAHVYGFIPETFEAALRLNGFEPLTADAAQTTTAVYRKISDTALDDVKLRDPDRARYLQDNFVDGSVAAYIFGGGYLKSAQRRFSKWYRDTFKV
jgi:2-polyprenyl-3-methyl-5-hydroxy-6-metoxy-1,4-benzoquinol methylase